MRVAKNLKGGARRKDRARLRNALRAILDVRHPLEPTVADLMVTLGAVADIAQDALAWAPEPRPLPVYVPPVPPPPPGPETLRRLARLDELVSEGKCTAEHAERRRREIPTEGWDAVECPACAGPCEFPADPIVMPEDPGSWWVEARARRPTRRRLRPERRRGRRSLVPLPL